ncbi:MAG: type IV toxin-antitoxin system AbiEi family antitoxin domain-containing protein [Nitrososphaeria archaeon]
MRGTELIKTLERSKTSVLSIGDVIKITGKDENYVKVLLNRLVKRKLLTRIEKNKYSLPNQNPFTVAASIIFPSYISFISAYSYYNLTTQIPSTIFIVSLKQRKEILYNKHRIKFVKFSRKRFFGYLKEYVEGKTVFIAEIEKAILDSLSFPKYCPLSETFFVLKEAQLDEVKLLEYSKRLNSGIVAKKLGYLLEVTGRDVYGSLKGLINKKYDLLNSLKPPTTKKSEKWKIIINEALE